MQDKNWRWWDNYFYWIIMHPYHWIVGLLFRNSKAFERLEHVYWNPDPGDPWHQESKFCLICYHSPNMKRRNKWKQES